MRTAMLGLAACAVLMSCGATPPKNPALGIAPAADTPAPRSERTGGLFAGLRRTMPDTAIPNPTEAPTAVAIPTGRVPFGQVVSRCDLTVRQAGKVVARADGGFRLIDPQPGSTELRTMYLSGFQDGCLRQTSAALALFGNFRTHETLRYLLSAKIRPYTKTDNTYETLKSKVCGAATGQPCGSNLRKFSRDGTFLSLQPSFSGSSTYVTLLLYDGQLVASDAP